MRTVSNPAQWAYAWPGFKNHAPRCTLCTYAPCATDLDVCQACADDTDYPDIEVPADSLPEVC